jgi:hypothetical protein
MLKVAERETLVSKLFDIIKSTRSELSALSTGQHSHVAASTDISPHVAKIMWCKTSAEKVLRH